MVQDWVWNRLIQMALEEDIGEGDLTTQAIIPADRPGEFQFVARQPLVVCGQMAVQKTFAMLDPEVRVDALVEDGQWVEARQPICRVGGSARSLLTGERVALNIMQHLSGIATSTRQVVDLVRDLPVSILDTRKTTPGWRAPERYAVTAGGGKNHRYSLNHAVLVKDNHIAAAGGVVPALERLREKIGPMVAIEVEVDTLDQVREVLPLRPHGILLDNMDVARMAEAVKIIDGRCWTEASGGIRPHMVRAIAEAGVDYISMGWLTHSTQAVDIGADWVF